MLGRCTRGRCLKGPGPIRTLPPTPSLVLREDHAGRRGCVTEVPQPKGHLVQFGELDPLLQGAAPADGRDVQHAVPELDEGATVVMGWEAGRNQREGENGPEFNPALPGLHRGREPTHPRVRAGASPGPIGETYPSLLGPRTERRGRAGGRGLTASWAV